MEHRMVFFSLDSDSAYQTHISRKLRGGNTWVVSYVEVTTAGVEVIWRANF